MKFGYGSCFFCVNFWIQSEHFSTAPPFVWSIAVVTWVKPLHLSTDPFFFFSFLPVNKVGTAHLLAHLLCVPQFNKSFSHWLIWAYFTVPQICELNIDYRSVGEDWCAALSHRVRCRDDSAFFIYIKIRKSSKSHPRLKTKTKQPNKQINKNLPQHSNKIACIWKPTKILTGPGVNWQCFCGMKVMCSYASFSYLVGNL